jgi:uncharacterized repeat protein (TIGR01451 family)
VLALLAALAMLVATGAQASNGRLARRSSAALTIRIVGLPPRVPASVLVRGPGLRRVLTGSRVLRHMRPGSYTIMVRQVHIRRGHHVRAGSLALPAQRRLAVRIAAGHGATEQVRYGTIIAPNVHLFKLGPVAVRGTATNPSAIVVRAPFRTRVGAILTARPSSKLPGGLFHRVRRVSRHGRLITLTLAPVHLHEAFPQIDFSSTVHLTPAAPAAAGHAAGFEPLVASLGIGAFRCAEPIVGDQLTSQLSLGLNAEVQLNIPTFFGIPDGLPEGKMALTLSGSAALQALVAKNSGCSANATLPPLSGAIPVGPVVVPVYAQVGASGSLTVASTLSFQANASAALTAGMEFHGFSTNNISAAHGSASVSASGSGRISVGPTLRLAVGVASIADVHFDAKPALAFSAALDGSCAVELVGGSQVGISIGPFQLNEPLPAPTATLYRCPPPPQLSISQSGPLGAFPNQEFGYAITVRNSSSTTARAVVVSETVPADGSFVLSSPGGSPASPGPGGVYTVPLGDIPGGQSRGIGMRWRAPAHSASLTASAIVHASNAAQAGPSSATVPVGTATSCNPCGAAAGGTGLRNRERGRITISGIPSGASVGRAVLIWSILYAGEVPGSSVTFDGHQVAADVTSNVSGNLCWGDTATVGYAADVTPYVSGNGNFEVSNPPRGETRVDENPEGALPFTDGATLVVFYNGGGANNQVLSDFSYNTNTDPTTSESITRSFSGIHSVGGPSSLTLAGPDGQNNFGKIFSFTGSTSFEVVNPFVGSAPQEGPSFPIGNLWDTEQFNMASILPSGQSTLTFSNVHTEDCVGVGAAVLQVAQVP